MLLSTLAQAMSSPASTAHFIFPAAYFSFQENNMQWVGVVCVWCVCVWCVCGACVCVCGVYVVCVCVIKKTFYREHIL